jgi:nucleotide-binding universal stress UspA family protein
VFRRILVTTDFHEQPNAAWDLAQELGRLCGAELLPLAAETILYYDVVYANVGAALEEERRAAAQRLGSVAAVARANGLVVRPLVRFGRTADVVAELAREEGVDLIILGIHGRRRLRRFVERQVVEHVIRAAPCQC